MIRGLMLEQRLNHRGIFIKYPNGLLFAEILRCLTTIKSCGVEPVVFAIADAANVE